MTEPTRADRLLDAHVEFVLAELSGDRLAEAVARDVDDVLAIAGSLRLNQVSDVERVKDIGRRLVQQVLGSPLAADLAGSLADAIYDLPASDDVRLGDVVERDPVEALVTKVLAMQPLHDRAMNRLAESPLVSAVAAKFVGAIVNDFVAQNRQIAEKLPGAKSLLSFGTSAASKVVRNTPLLGEAAERGTQLAIRRTNNAMREVIRDAPLKGAALELWDLHADEPIGELREYLSRADLREIVLLVHGIVVEARGTEYAGALVDECVEVFFERYGDRPVAELLPELGIGGDDIVADLRAVLPLLVEAARADGRLERFVRDRLAPFYASAAAQAVLAD
ncbi:MAG: hypothetical protein J0H43_08480 [Actinobacteria bacterium]|nr:hypothetical protein [Actinomycetota bacterium]